MTLDLSSFLAIFQTTLLLVIVYLLVRFSNSRGQVTWDMQTTKLDLTGELLGSAAETRAVRASVEQYQAAVGPSATAEYHTTVVAPSATPRNDA